MSMDVDAQIVQLQAREMTQDQICAALHVGSNRVSPVLHFFKTTAYCRHRGLKDDPEK
jgi:predicted XRE-type DNA-binding protein